MAAKAQPAPRIWVGKKITKRGPSLFRVNFTVNGAHKTRTASSLAQALEIQELLKSGVIPDAQRQVVILSPAELEERRTNPQYEEEHGIERVRACRICGKCYANLGPTTAGGHLLTDHDGMILVEYRDYCRERGWGTPSTLCPRFLKLSLKKVKQRKADKPEQVQQEVAQATANFKERYNTDPVFRARNLEKQQRNRSGKRQQAFGDKLLQCPHCPGQFRTLRKHIQDIHPEKLQPKQQELPMIVPELGAQHFQRLEEGKAKKKTAQEQKLSQVQAKLQQAIKAAQGSDERLAHAVDEAIPIFRQLFASSEVKGNPKILTRNGWTLPGYSLDMMTAAGGAVENSRRPKHWPKYAAISFVATMESRERKSVQRAYDRFHASQIH